MAKAKRQVQENLKYVDFVIEVVDARLPLSSRNPLLDKILGEKPRLLVLNKADLAIHLGAWKKELAPAIAINAKEKQAGKQVVAAATELLASKIQRNTEKGIVHTVLRAMVVGIPNSGKSTLLNNLAGKKSAKTGNRPGVTQSQQWIRSNKELEILDTPGILWPKFEDQKVGLKLALTGAIKDDLYPLDDVAIYGLSYFKEQQPGLLEKVYGISPEENLPNYIENLTKKLGFKEDYDRFYVRFIQDVRNGRLGRFCLDLSDEMSEEKIGNH